MRRVIFGATVSLAVLLSASVTQAAPITGWMTHNGTDSLNVTDPNNPTFTNAGTSSPSVTNTLMAPFSDVALVNDGDYVEVKTTLTMTGRTANTGAASLNTQLRLGLFDDSANSTLTAADFPNVGYTIEYSANNMTNRPMLREQTGTTQTTPFTNTATMTLINNPTAPSSQISGANPGAITFDIKITRNSGKIDLVGSIIDGTYEEDFGATGYTPAIFPANGTFTFNRIGLFLGGNLSDGTSVLSSSQVLTNTPEPSSFLFVIGLASGIIPLRRPGR